MLHTCNTYEKHTLDTYTLNVWYVSRMCNTHVSYVSHMFVYVSERYVVLKLC